MTVQGDWSLFLRIERITEQEWRNKMEEKQRPDNKFKAGAVTTTVWTNETNDRQGNKFSVYTVAYEAYEYLVRNGSENNGNNI